MFLSWQTAEGPNTTERDRGPGPARRLPMLARRGTKGHGRARRAPHQACRGHAITISPIANSPLKRATPPHFHAANKHGRYGVRPRPQSSQSSTHPHLPPRTARQSLLLIGSHRRHSHQSATSPAAQPAAPSSPLDN